MSLTYEQEAIITMTLVRHRTDADGNCSCGRLRSHRIGTIADIYMQEAHQAQAISDALSTEGATADRACSCCGGCVGRH